MLKIMDKTIIYALRKVSLGTVISYAVFNVVFLVPNPKKRGDKSFTCEYVFLWHFAL